MLSLTFVVAFDARMPRKIFYCQFMITNSCNLFVLEIEAEKSMQFQGIIAI